MNHRLHRMKPRTTPLLLLPLAILLVLATPGRGQISSGNYRLPYADGVDATVQADQNDHVLPNRVDFIAASNSIVVAADDGVVRRAYDSGNPGCNNCTNYVWIEHANGEWTGYFYLQAGSVTATYLLAPGSNVVAGQPIGIQGNVGSPGGRKLRFEVGVPTNVNDPIDTGTGLLKGVNRYPAICNIKDNVLRTGETYDPRPCIAQEISHAVYRLPYANNVTMQINQDHLTHSPIKTPLDVRAFPLNAPNPIVAVADGIVMMIMDTNTVNCTTNGCSDFNNYVWIAHANGEWSKYSHFRTGSVTTNAGLRVGTNVVAGQYLGDEGNIGFAFGQHLHFEIGAPRDGTNSLSMPGAFIDGGGPRRVPLFCSVPGYIAYKGDSFVCQPCSGGCEDDILLSAATIRGTRAYVASDTVDSNNAGIRVDTWGSLALMAGQKITLRPGFRAARDSYLRASIRPCNASP